MFLVAKLLSKELLDHLVKASSCKKAGNYFRPNDMIDDLMEKY